MFNYTSVTFLATILVLVLLSGSLIVRSYLLRRRYRVRIQQAIADGLFVDIDRSAFTGAGLFPPVSFASPLYHSTRYLGPKPMLWEAYIRPNSKETQRSSSPFLPSATPIALQLSSSSLPSDPSWRSPALSPSPSPHQRPSFFSYFRHRSGSSNLVPPQSYNRLSQPSLNDTHSSQRDPLASPSMTHRTDRDLESVSVCVLISMPDARFPSLSQSNVSDKGKGVDKLDSPSKDATPKFGLSMNTQCNENFPPVEFGIVEMKTTSLEDLPRAKAGEE